jgi:hypothetical protein
VSVPRIPRRAVETGLLLASALALVWLSRRPRGAEPLVGALGEPWTSTALALMAACVAPGYVLSRWAGAGRDALGTAAFSAGLGLAWLLVPCAGVLALGGNIHDATAWATALDLGLLAAYLARPPRARPAPGGRVPPQVATAVLLCALPLLAVTVGHRGFSFSSDEWYLLRSTRYVLDAGAIETTGLMTTFDVWNVAVAMLVKLAGVGLVEGWRTLLPAFLLPAALLAFLALARALFHGWGVPVLALAVQALLALSDMSTRGEGTGMGLLVRLTEDKYAALFLLTPLAQAAFLRFLRAPRAAPLVLGAALGAAATAVHPMAAVWLALSLGGCCALGLATGRLRLPRRSLLAAGAAAALVLAVAGALRAQRPAHVFTLHAPEWTFNERLLELTRRQLLILSREDGWVMGHPALLAHPLTIVAVVSALWMAPRWRRSLAARFLSGAVLLPLLVLYLPPAASALAWAISPWMLHRIPWGLPASLAVAAAAHDGLGAWLARLRPAAGRRAPAAVALVALLAALLAPAIRRSLGALQRRNHVEVTDGERDLFHAMAADRRLGGTVVAPPALSIHLGAWSSRFHALPGQDAFRNRMRELLEPCARLRNRHRIRDEDAYFLRSVNVSYVVARVGSRLDRALVRAAPAFPPVFRGTEYALFAWRPERWEQARER